MSAWALVENKAALLSACRATGMEALVECHDERELDVALSAGASVVGVNNRDLRSLRVDLAVSERLLPLVPTATIAVAESGVRTPDDARRLRAAGASNLLIGEALMRASDPAAFLRSLEGDP